MSQARKVRKAVFPVAGLGTRFLPATKAVPKEMLTVVDKPVIQYVVDEALDAGIEHLIFVTGRSKAVIEDYFDIQVELEQTLRQRNKTAELTLLESILPVAGSTSFTRQQEPLGLGHAVWCARELVGNEPFALLLPDMIMKGEKGCLKGMVELFEHSGANVIAVEECAPEQSHKYGIVGVGEKIGDGFAITKMVEKPPQGTAPSNFFINGRYILQPEIFPILSTQERGAGNEIQLTDAMVKLADVQKFAAYHFRGETYDCGAKDGFILANIAFALARADIRPAVEGPLKELVAKLK
ncbi:MULTISPECIES: UTP--glucose-1-phosphate uridylyltransferase GalU [unclassified Shinella]|jgi:UTP--glucose-1-phosphate uridylyltransferase|uniref:UTP--glucose-1-phosphate uridylyltransferase GalU n=1 Tax=unclassified Shinella TaxID=2643062 RepID=UPI0006818707|nr:MULTISPECIES: UTP--glucose-1-phosphate uridylyltransferase GalU [unclassified Shinella]MCO5057530.1 UTP--glucose-1-phosphate uridylyltransferase GalU [Rhizobiaceae bacterium]KNY17345.1 UTP--glucose-1-phosphate uridylyltransferase [Shinella sp. SUS2]KOC72435.1 UTP--glucose-1-phosphate uridylyltransferase [Shinella sp. GWS1]MCO5150693.1 UTP--glucose-1-phosphate uridylyltransferase GalU [Shinella sp.]MDC7263296.1 UTP--glucose-1-phosphate uridylyltransferase GalU [Shinella sp. HY16]